MMINYAAIILAAGQSSRLGRAKQLLEWKGKSFVQHTFDVAARFVPPDQIIIVTGARQEQVEAHLSKHKLPFTHNPDWPEGMGSSIRTGTNVLLQAFPNIEAILIMVCDQVKIEPFDLQPLFEAHQANPEKAIVARYLNRVGVPVIFPKAWLAMLRELEGDRGARAILRNQPDALYPVDLPKAAFDVDTEEDYRNLLGNA